MNNSSLIVLPLRHDAGDARRRWRRPVVKRRDHLLSGQRRVGRQRVRLHVAPAVADAGLVLNQQFSVFHLSCSIPAICAERDDHNLLERLNKSASPSKARRRGGQARSKPAGDFQFSLLPPPFPYWKSNVNCIGALPRIRSTFKLLTPSARSIAPTSPAAPRCPARCRSSSPCCLA